jgi:hypothetical protein
MRIDRQLLAAAVAVCGLAGLLGPGVADAQAQLYRWVDENGVTHWSDRPVRGAEKVEVPAAQGFKPPPVPQRSVVASAPAPGGQAGPAGPVTYSSVEIVRPANDEAFVNTGGTVDVAASLSPALASGHRTWFVHDGRRLEGPSPSATSITLEAVRGTHTIAIEIADETGAVVASSAPVTFHVRQTSIANPPVGPSLRPPAPVPLPTPRPARP